MATLVARKPTVTKFIVVFDPGTSAYWLALDGIEKGDHVLVAVSCDPGDAPPEEVEIVARRILKLGRAKIGWTRRVRPPAPTEEGSTVPAPVFEDGWNAVVKR